MPHRNSDQALRRISAWVASLAFLILGACGGGGSNPATPPGPPPTLEIGPHAPEVVVGSPVALYAYLSTADPKAKLVWETTLGTFGASETPEHVWWNPGSVTGTATIRVHLASNPAVKATTTFEVRHITPTLSADRTSVEAQQTLEFVTGSHLPTTTKFTWTTTGGRILSDQGGNRAVIQAPNVPGTYTVTVRPDDDPDQSASRTFTVVDQFLSLGLVSGWMAPSSKIRLTPIASGFPREQIAYEVIEAPPGCSLAFEGNSLQFQAGATQGVARLRASFPDSPTSAEAVLRITTDRRPIVVIDDSPIRLHPRDTGKVTWRVLDTLDQRVLWHVQGYSNTSVSLNIDATGTISGVTGNGLVVITARSAADEFATADFQFWVEEGRLTPDPVALDVGQTQKFSASNPGDPATAWAFHPFGYSPIFGGLNAEGTYTAPLVSRFSEVSAKGTTSDGSFRDANATITVRGTGPFQTVANFHASRKWSEVLPLPDGRRLLLGGINTRSVEALDPVTGAIEILGTLQDYHYHSAATLVDSDTLFIMGGDANQGWEPTFGTVELFSLSQGKTIWSQKLDLPWSTGKAILLQDGRVAVWGQWLFEQALQSGLRLFDPSTGTFGPILAPARKRDSPSLLLRPDGTLLLVGGYITLPTGRKGIPAVDVFDPATDTFTDIGDMNYPTWGHALQLLSDGRVLITGGASEWFAAEAGIEIFDPISGTSQEAGLMNFQRFGGHQLCALGNDTFAIFSQGIDNSGAVEFYDAKTGADATITATTVLPSWEGAASWVDGTDCWILNGLGTVEKAPIASLSVPLLPRSKGALVSPAGLRTPGDGESRHRRHP